MSVFDILNDLCCYRDFYIKLFFTQVVISIIFATVSAIPLESKVSEKSVDSPIQLVRPSPINPDIPMDPKPPERIILDDTKPERDRKSLNNDTHQDSKIEVKGSESSSDNQHHDQHTVKTNDKASEAKQSESKKGNYDEKRKSDEKVIAKSKAKELIPSVKSNEPTIVYAVKAEQINGGFQTSHRIPNIDGSGTKFETSHHIPTHIENERTKAIENAKIDRSD